MTPWLAVALVASAMLADDRTIRALHMFQMDSYSASRYVKWLLAKPFERAVDLIAVIAALVILALSYFAPAAVLLWAAVCGFLWYRRDKTPPKKPLDLTARAKRILFASRMLMVFTGFALVFLMGNVLAVLLFIHLAPAATVVANVLLKPVQAHINRGFVIAAEKKMRELKPLVIGVAGSYGKTSTKYFIDTLLLERFRTLKTPGNVNTQLGVTRIVNETLTAQHEVFIVEMGAYQRGDVKDVADIVHPKIGIITSIGPEHWERFKTFDNIERTNYEVIDPLPKDGLALFNCENEHCRKLADQTKHTRVIRYALTGGDIWAEEIVHSVEGMSFTIVTKAGQRIPAACELVGRHNVLNILGAAAIALDLGLTPEEITRGVSKLKSAPNRLEVKKGQGGTTILDDSYNSNPIGAAEALHVLSQYTTGKRVLVTPGMIELGDLHQEKNEELGRLAATSCDHVFLVGPEQTRPIAKGLRSASFPEERIHIVKDLQEATTMFAKLLRPGDVILFENDLPDLYTEK